jgi:hypothetical protein
MSSPGSALNPARAPHVTRAELREVEEFAQRLEKYGSEQRVVDTLRRLIELARRQL